MCGVRFVPEPRGQLAKYSTKPAFRELVSFDTQGRPIWTVQTATPQGCVRTRPTSCRTACPAPQRAVRASSPWTAVPGQFLTYPSGVEVPGVCAKLLLFSASTMLGGCLQEYRSRVRHTSWPCSVLRVFAEAAKLDHTRLHAGMEGVNRAARWLKLRIRGRRWSIPTAAFALEGPRAPLESSGEAATCNPASSSCSTPHPCSLAQALGICRTAM